jgi:hypothetical protein
VYKRKENVFHGMKGQGRGQDWVVAGSFFGCRFRIFFLTFQGGKFIYIAFSEASDPQ